MAYIENPLGKTFYQTRGRLKSGIPLICLHGGPGGDSRGLQPMLTLGAERKVFIYDQIGGGQSSATKKKDWKIETFVRELKALIQAWGLDEFHLYGGSWGTTLALEYYIRTGGKKVQSLIFQSPMFSAKDWANDCQKLILALPKKDQQIIKTCQAIGATDAQVYKEAMLKFYRKHVLRNKELLDQKIQKMGRSAGRHVYKHMWGDSEFFPTGTLRNYQGARRLGDIGCPSLVICGQYDEAIPSRGQSYARKIPAGQFKLIKGASHAILTEKPGPMLKTISSFLREQT